MSLLGAARHAWPMGVRTRYTILYGAMILVTGLGLIAIIGAFGSRSTSVARQGTVPAPAAEQIERLQRQLDQADEAHSRQLLLGVVVGMVVALLLSLLLGRLLAGRVLRPLRVITARPGASRPTTCTGGWPSTGRRTR